MKNILILVSIISSLSFADSELDKKRNDFKKMFINLTRDTSVLCDKVVALNRKDIDRMTLIKKKDCVELWSKSSVK